jgi:hypothetical protein
MTTPDHKMYWDILETLRWIGARGEEGIMAMGDIDEKKRTPLTIFPLNANESGHNRAGPSPKLFAAASAQPSYSDDGDKMRQIPC